MGGRRRDRAVDGVGRRQGRDGEQVEDVHQDQFLMLFLVREPKHDEVAHRRGQRRRQQPHHGGVDIGAIAEDLADRRARQQSARGPWMPRPDRLIVGVEEIAEHRVERRIALLVRRQQEGLEKPRRMRQVPFGRAGVRHRLGCLVLVRQPRREGDRCTPDRLKTFDQGLTQDLWRRGAQLDRRGVVGWRHGQCSLNGSSTRSFQTRTPRNPGRSP